MQYCSTRDASVRVDAAKAIAQGLSRDGGLFCPTEIPKITNEEFLKLLEMSYQQRAAFVIGKFLTDYSAEELNEYADTAYHSDRFSAPAVAPVYPLCETANVLELWHGPTCAFKDMALQILPYLLTSALKKTGETKKACILVATSGDTGKAALEGFADVDGVQIAVFYPKDGVSRVQELQMTTQSGNNVYVSSVYGNFDHVQSKMKEIFSDEGLRARAEAKNTFFSSANSINWGRAVPQIAYYVSGYCDMVKNGTISFGDKINVCVPTGNFGNILAAYYAREMGVPIAKLICASNKNNVLTDFFRTGCYNRKREFHVTISPAMDILISSNLERLLFHLSGQDDAKVKDYMSKLTNDGVYQIDDMLKQKISELFYAGYCDDERASKTISDTFSEYHYLIDTHTAVGVSVYQDYVEETQDTTKTLIASTASPFKFSDSVLAALGINTEIDGTELLDILSKTTNVTVPAPLAELKNKTERFVNAVTKEEIVNAVFDFIG